MPYILMNMDHEPAWISWVQRVMTRDVGVTSNHLRIGVSGLREPRRETDSNLNVLPSR